MKEVEWKIQQDVVYLEELKADTEETLKQIQEERQNIEALKTGVGKLQPFGRIRPS